MISHKTPHVDQFKWGKEMSCTTTDLYPCPVENSEYDAFEMDVCRGNHPEGRWFLMEQTTSQVVFRPHNYTKEPGKMRLWSYQNVAHGADGILFFQWRKSLAGSEKFHGAIVGHTPPHESREFLEAKQLGNELKNLAPVVGSQLKAKTALLFDWNAWWAVEGPARPVLKNDYKKVVQAFYRALWEQNITVDIVTPNADLSDYKLVVAPMLHACSESDCDNLKRYVENGGCAVVSFFSGVVDEHDHIVPGGYPGHWRDMIGLWVELWQPLSDIKTNSIAVEDSGERYCADYLAEVLHVQTAEVLARYEQDFFADEPAVTRNRFGQGQAYYVSTLPDKAYLKQLFASIAADIDLKPALSVPDKVEIVQRHHDNKTFTFLLNHSAEEKTVDLQSIQGTELITQAPTRSSITLEAHGVAVIES